MNKKAQTSGLVIGLVMGMAMLIIATIIAFVIVSNVSSIDDTIYTTTVPVQIINESVTTFNESGDLLSVAGLNGATCTMVYLINSTNYVAIPANNYTLNNCNLVAVSSPFTNYTVKATYTYTYHQSEETADRMISNFTGGVNNVSSKIPTVFLVGAIVLILGILAVLVGVWQKMRMGNGSL
jgi:hypothetical protein